MIDWGRSVEMACEFFEVDRATWQDARDVTQLVLSARVSFSADDETKGSATFELLYEPRCAYIRPYVVARQGGEEERSPLGAWLVPTATRSIGHSGSTWSAEAYSPLRELAVRNPEPCRPVAARADAMSAVAEIAAAHCSAPFVRGPGRTVLAEAMCAELGESWLSFLSKLLERCGAEFGLDPAGRVIAVPKRDVASMQPTYRLEEGSASIVECDGATDSSDLADVPNVVTVVHSTPEGCAVGIARNDDPLSPFSTVNMGQHDHYEGSPEIDGIEDMGSEEMQAAVQRRAEELLDELSQCQREAVYRRDFCADIRVGDCVWLGFGGLGRKGLVTAQDYDLAPDSVRVTETASSVERAL